MPLFQVLQNARPAPSFHIIPSIDAALGKSIFLSCMAIKILKYEEAFPQSGADLDSRQATCFGYASAEYYTACLALMSQHESIGILTNVLLPSMHQCLELLVKAIAKKIDPQFNQKNKKYSHRTWNIIKEYSPLVLGFEGLLNDSAVRVLFEELEKSYFVVRYGSGVLQFDGDAWELFQRVVDDLLDVLRHLTELRFPIGIGL